MSAISKEQQQEIINGLDKELKDEIVEMTCDLVNISSPTGEEAAIADYVAGRYKELGLEVRFQEVEPGRSNVIARQKGKGRGKSLLFNAHFDTSTTGREEGLPIGHKPIATRNNDGWIHGLAVSNMKNAFAGYYGALKLLRKAGVEPAGDITICGVVGEIEKAPVDEYQGASYRGGGLGTIVASHYGVIADNAILGEPTGMRVQLGNSSYFFARIQLRGVAQHTFCKENGVDAIEKGIKVIEALRKWEPDYEARYPHPRMGSRIGIGAVMAGYPFKPAICPAPYCNIYVDFRWPPTFPITQVKRDVDEFLASLNDADPELDSELSVFVCRQGGEISADEELATVLTSSHQSVFGKDPVSPTRYRYTVSSDPTILMQYGIPALTYGAGGIRPDGSYSMYDDLGEILSIDNLHRVTTVYALAAAQLTQERNTN